MSDEERPETPPGPLGVPHVEDVAAPIVYADHCLGGGVSGAGDNITLTFAVKILDHRAGNPAALTKTVLRLVLPRGVAVGTAEFVRELVASLEAGSAPPDKNTTIN